MTKDTDDERFNTLIEKAVEQYRKNKLDLDSIIQEYGGCDLENFIVEVTNALALEEIFREHSERKHFGNDGQLTKRDVENNAKQNSTKTIAG